MSSQADASLQASRVAATSLPVVDVGGLGAGAGAEQRVAAAMRAACLDKGFMYIRNHGIHRELIDAVFAASKAFFGRPEEEKLSFDMRASKASRGYERMQSQVLEAGTPPDLKESFYIGREYPADHPGVLAGRFGHAPNQWPNLPKSFRPTMEAYYAEVLRLAERLMAGIAVSLGLHRDHFAAFCQEPLANLRLLHYPEQPGSAPAGLKGAGAHTDFGGLTVLLQDRQSGLQVFDKATGEWLHAPPIADTFVVNIGDLLARWTNDKYRSTLHRVVNDSGVERYSVAFFFSGNLDYEVRCLPECLDPGEQPRYEPTTVEAHFREMFQRSYAATTGGKTVAQ
jgi:isopenicillin N synthase-like dioxygenase